MESQPYPRPVALARALFGAILFCFPEMLLRAAPHRNIDHPADVVARILGARHLIEAALVGRRRGRNWILVSFAIDTIHAITAFAFGGIDEKHRRLAVTNGVTATAFAAADLHEALEAD